ncbi:ead/Ea22-like family protein [Klebsiella pneumoniae]
MTTDITELAQRMKAAAEKATPGPWERGDGKHGGELLVYCDDALGSAVCEATSEYNAIPKYQRIDNLDFIAMANPANILALVEALEKAQQVDEELCRLLPPGAEYMDPPDGGDVTPLEGVRRMVADYRQRIAELESRTVKLPDLRQIVSGDRYVWSDGVYNYSQDVKVTLAAAGIKVEAE